MRTKHIIFRKPIKSSVRYSLLQKANGKCALCGRTVLHDGITLHIDHILPVCAGGSNKLTNLRVVCADCNLGKSIFDKVECNPNDRPPTSEFDHRLKRARLNPKVINVKGIFHYLYAQLKHKTIYGGQQGYQGKHMPLPRDN